MRNRAGTETIKERRKAKRAAKLALRAARKAAGLGAPAAPTIPNHTCKYGSPEEEHAAREEALTEQLRVMRAQLPTLLRRFSKIEDPRDPKKTKHRLTMLMLYGILMFVYQMGSRRATNQKMTRPQFMANLAIFFPELESLPHHDTLNRLLSVIDVEEIMAAHVELMRQAIRKKKFHRYLVENCYPIAIDGSQKLVRSELLSEEWLERHVKKGETQVEQYYVYVLEANLALRNGMSLPLITEFLDFAEGDTSRDKQDCETRAFRRLAKRLKKEFPRLPVMVLLDGLYPSGPIMKICDKNRWQFMIVLQDASLPSVWDEFRGLKRFHQENRREQVWGGRRQQFQWVNHIEYEYGSGRSKRRRNVHVVVCEESWEAIDDQTGQKVTRTSRHAWLSSKPLHQDNVQERCNLGARHRWAIESGFLVEKCHGYNYEHCYSINWKAMKGYHYLMRLAHTINVLAQYSTALIKSVRTLGVRGFIEFLRETLAVCRLDASSVRLRLEAPFQLRFD